MGRLLHSWLAEVAQLVEQRTENAWVPSSSLGLGTIGWLVSYVSKRAWLSGRASPCQGEGHEFESRRPLKKAGGSPSAFFIPATWPRG